MSRNFDPANEAVVIGDVANARWLNNTAWSFFVFFRVEDTSAARSVISKYSNATTNRQFRMLIGTGRATALRFNNDATVIGSPTVSLNTWYLAAGTSDTSGNINFYIFNMDGSLLGSASGTHPGDASTLTAGIQLGLQENNAGDFDGDIAFAAYFDGVEFTQAQCLTYLYNPVAFTAQNNANCEFFLPVLGDASPEPDWSGNGNNGTVSGASVSSDMPPASMAIPFSPYVTLPAGAVTEEVALTLARIATIAQTADAQAEGAETLARTAAISQAADAQTEATETLSRVAAISQVGDAQTEGAETLSRIAMIAQAADAQTEAAETLSRTLAISQSADAQTEGAEVLSRVMAVTQGADAQAEGAALLARIAAVAQAADAQAEASLTLSDILVITLNGGLDVQGAFTLGRLAGLTTDRTGSSDQAVTLAIFKGDSLTASAAAEGALGLARSGAITQAGGAQTEGGATLGRQLAIVLLATATTAAALVLSRVGAVTFDGVEVITVYPTPIRTLDVAADDRIFSIPGENRTLDIDSESRIFAV